MLTTVLRNLVFLTAATAAAAPGAAGDVEKATVEKETAEKETAVRQRLWIWGHLQASTTKAICGP